MLIGPEKTLADEQSRMNDSTRGAWDWYANHRKHIEQLIVPQKQGGRIGVLGAGNCNDLDLQWLTQAYAEVHLIDIDPAALQRAVRRQQVEKNPRLILHAPVDLTGIANITAGWKGRAVSEAEVDAAISHCTDLVPTKQLKVDAVLSPCVLSQLLCGVRDLLGKNHPSWPRLKNALRTRHLRHLIDVVAPLGRAVLVVDLASTSAIPGLDRAQQDQLDDLMRFCLRDGKCFRGLEPNEITSALRAQPALRGAVGGSVISKPWLWHLALNKAFLVYAMTLRKMQSA